MVAIFKSPLTIYVLWHPAYADGKWLADRLFNVFSRNVDDPFARTPGIPLYFRSTSGQQDATSPRSIPVDDAHHTAIVVLVDDQMVVSEAWSSYVAELDRAAAESSGHVRLFPVAVNSRSFNFPIANTNFIRLFEVREEQPSSPVPAVVGEQPLGAGHLVPATVEPGVTINIFVNGEQSDSIRVEHTAAKPARAAAVVEAESLPATDADEGQPTAESKQPLLERQATFLIGKLAHELSRLLYHRPRTTDQGVVQSAPPVRMFISHAKADGADIAAAIRNQIHADTSLKSFFDANDIAVGYRFSAELLAALEESAVICLQTDHYATREWCLWEVINAKRLDRPVVVVNAVSDREPRSFPYIGNAPTIRWRSEHPDTPAQIQEVLDLTLFEVLGTRFRQLFHRELIKTFDLPENTSVLGHPPELFTIVKLTTERGQQGDAVSSPRYVVYPDPPLGDEELRLLEQMAPQIRFVTPMMLPLIQQLTKNHPHEYE